MNLDSLSMSDQFLRDFADRRFTPAERARVLELIGERGSGGNFYNTLPVRVSKRFARALVTSTLPSPRDMRARTGDQLDSRTTRLDGRVTVRGSPS